MAGTKKHRTITFPMILDARAYCIYTSCRDVSHTPIAYQDDKVHEGVYNTPLRSPSNNIGAIIRGYKASVTRQLKVLQFEQQVWQRNYYEHIIRDQESYHKIADYIEQNPMTWEQDRFFQTTP